MGHCVHDLSLFKNELLLLSQAGKKRKSGTSVSLFLFRFFSIHILYYTIIVKKSK